jgi:mitochondrial fission protein ELM1
MGDLAQCRGVAAQLSDPSDIQEQVVTPNWLTRLPLPNMPLSAVDRQQDFFARDPDIIIASGRRTIPYLKAFADNAAKKAFTVFLKDPRHARKSFDFIWAPEHDGLSGANVFSTLTAPHIYSNDVLEAAKAAAIKRHNLNGQPVTGVILGGNSGTVDWDGLMSVSFAAPLAQIDPTHKVLVTASRRTPGNLLNAVKLALEHHDSWFWDGEGENPYGEILGASQDLIVTGDSHNMVSEAVATTASVNVFRPKGLHKKLIGFLDALETSGQIRSLLGGLELQERQALNATPEIAAEITRRMNFRA